MTRTYLDITAQEVIEAYKKNNLLPSPGHVYRLMEPDGIACCCGVGALLGGPSWQESYQKPAFEKMAELGIAGDPTDYWDFTFGFDHGLQSMSKSKVDCKIYHHAYEIGQQVRLAFPDYDHPGRTVV